jgi:hypothetical protein
MFSYLFFISLAQVISFNGVTWLTYNDAPTMPKISPTRASRMIWDGVSVSMGMHKLHIIPLSAEIPLVVPRLSGWINLTTYMCFKLTTWTSTLTFVS